MKEPRTLQDTKSGFFLQIESLSPVKRIVIAATVIILLIGAFTWFIHLPQSQAIDNLEKDLAAKQGQLNLFISKAKKIDQFREEMAQTEQKFKIAMEALPEKDEIPALLSGVSRSGHEAGMEFLLFEPKGEQFKEFYAEIPVLLKLTGSYQQIGRFFEMVAKLPRIVNLQDLSISTPKEGEPLTTSCTAVTYKFVEPSPDQKKEGAPASSVSEKLKKLKENEKTQ
jgi:type IV pilus assembly protein PilO